MLWHDTLEGFLDGHERAAIYVREQVLEVLLGLTQALSMGMAGAGVRPLEDRINERIRGLSAALARLQFPRDSLPDWLREDFSENQLFWFMTAMTAFYDEGI